MNTITASISPSRGQIGTSDAQPNEGCGLTKATFTVELEEQQK